jgi:hypothetical protein
MRPFPTIALLFLYKYGFKFPISPGGSNLLPPITNLSFSSITPHASGVHDEKFVEFWVYNSLLCRIWNIRQLVCKVPSGVSKMVDIDRMDLK